MIYRDAYYHRETTSSGEAELLPWPPQHGQLLATLSWDTPSGTFGAPIHMGSERLTANLAIAPISSSRGAWQAL